MQQHVNEKVICISKDGSRIGYKKTRREKITNLDHIFNIIRPSRSQQISKYSNENDSDVECPICCSGFSDTGKYVSKCGHVFHLECIVPWYSKHITCPVCRSGDILYPLDVTIKQNP